MYQEGEEETRMDKDKEKRQAKKVVYLYGRKSCPACIAEDKHWRKKQDIKYRFVGIDSKRGQAFKAKHKVKEIPIVSVCTSSGKSGKMKCSLSAGHSPNTRKKRD